MADPKADPKDEKDEVVPHPDKPGDGSGLDPSPNPQVVVKSVNPPVTPDQVVSMAEAPSSAVQLPDVKLQNIKIPPVKNKTIQGHLKAIEAKMIATEKLMKDIVKLQKVQIHTEKELHERRRELYQNTFEEYLLDKTIDFEDPDDPDCTCINLPKKPPGMPPLIGGGGGGGTKVPVRPMDKAAEEEEKENAEQPVSPVLQPNPPPVQPNWTPEEIEELNERLTRRRKELDPSYDPMEEEAPLPQVVPPGITPTPVPLKPIDVPTPKADPADIAVTIGVLQYIRKNTKNKTPTIRRKDGYVVTLDNSGNPRIFKPGELELDPLSQTLLRSMAVTNAIMTTLPAGAMRGARGRPVAPLRPRPRQPAPLPRVNPPGVPTPQPANDIVPGPKVTPRTQPLLPAAKPAAVPASKQTVDVQPLSKSVERDLAPGIREIVGQSMGRGARNPIKKRSTGSTIEEQIQQSGGTTTGEGTYEITNQASGGISDLNLYSAESQQYFRNLSSNMEIPRFADGGFNILNPMSWFRGDLKKAADGELENVSNDTFAGQMYNRRKQQEEAMRKLRGYQGGGIVDWWNKGRNMRVPSENTSSWRDLMRDDARQITRSNKAFRSGASGIRGWNPFKAFTPEMVRTGPTPAVRQAFERPVRFVRDQVIRRAVTSAVRPMIAPLIKPLVAAGALILATPTPAGGALYGPGSADPRYRNVTSREEFDKLEAAQGSMRSGSNNNQPEIMPLPPDYIKIPGKPQETKEVGIDVPGIDMPSSIFTRSSVYLD